MKQTKPHYMGFRTTDEQAAKLSRIADRTGGNTSTIIRWLVDSVQETPLERSTFYNAVQIEPDRRGDQQA